MSALPSSFSFDYLDFPSPKTTIPDSQPSTQPHPDLYSGLRFEPNLRENPPPSNYAVNSNQYNEVEKLKMQLNLKTQIISNLQKKCAVKELVEQDPITNSSFYKLFSNVSNQLKAKTEECNKLTTYLESVLVSMAINSGESSHDEMIHKIVNKINSLSEENEKLMEIISSSSKLNLIIEIGVLRNEVQSLRDKLSRYEK